MPQTDLLAEHAQHQQGHDAPPDSHPPGATDYAAAFFVLLFWLVYGLLRSETNVRLARGLPKATERLALAEVPNLPRGPTPPLLQVFRL